MLEGGQVVAFNYFVALMEKQRGQGCSTKRSWKVIVTGAERKIARVVANGLVSDCEYEILTVYTT